ncbi:MAG: DUF2254 domain-containing protein [Actinobacteria bacterium]|nr:DUF2254 domain-containing protein [Actinomycetota bacterium]
MDATDGRLEAATVRARVATRENIARMNRSERAASALWPVPLAFGLAAILVARVTAVIDSRDALGIRGEFLIRDPDTALQLASVVASGMLVFLGIVFSTTLVAIQLAGSQYSPRAVRIFLRLRLTKVALGVFVATFVFAVAVLGEIRTKSGSDFTPTASLTVLVLLMVATVVTFLVFASGTARLLRIQYLVERIADEARPVFRDAFTRAQEVQADRPAPATATRVCTNRSPGVLDAVDVADLADAAAAAEGWIDVVAPVGGYVATGAPLAVVHGGGGGGGGDDRDGDQDVAIRRCFLLSNERTMLEDPAFGLRQLVDVAIRGLSPAVNDPTTAVQVIDRITDLLGGIADRPDPPEWYVDAAGTARVRMRGDTFDDLLRLGYVEIIRYGAGAPQVVRRLHAAFGSLSALGDARHHASIAAMGALLDAAVADAMPAPFSDLSGHPDPRGLG